MSLSRDNFFRIVAGCGAILCVFYLLRPISDPDFWWHLKTGEEMFRTGGLLSGDPFDFTSDAVMSARERVILHGYWLWQLLYSAVYALAGLSGILVLNVLLALAIYATLVRLLVRVDLDKGIAALLLMLSLGAFLPYYRLFERPQIFSFLFCLILVALFDRFRDRRELSKWLFPLMLVWGNVHGGVGVGIGLLILFAIGIGIQLCHDRKLVTHCLLWAAGGILCGFANPAGIYIIPELLKISSGQQAMFGDVLEYVSTPQLFFREGHYWIVCLWLLMLVHGVGLIFSRRRWLADTFLYLALLAASFWYARNIAFFAVCLLPQTAYYCKEIKPSESRWFHDAARGGCVALLVLLLLQGYQRQEMVFSGQVSSFYPVRLVEFMQQAGIGGKIFNDYDWGGFLLWKLYPGSRLFWDGRCLDEKVYDHARRIRWTSPLPVDGKAEYAYLLGKYGVEIVIQKNISKIGLTEPLMRNLLQTDEWIPVYQDDLGYVLMKNQDKSRGIIERYRIGRSDFLQNILQLYQRNIDATNDPRMYLGRGELYLYLNDLAGARRDLSVAKQGLGKDEYLDKLLAKAGL